jgi:CBS domain-containing protein
MLFASCFAPLGYAAILLPRRAAHIGVDAEPAAENPKNLSWPLLLEPRGRSVVARSGIRALSDGGEAALLHPGAMLAVRDVMTERVAAVGPGATLKQVAETLLDKGVSGLPVVDEAHRVLGVVSETDIVAKTAQGVVVGGLTAVLADVAGGGRRLEATTAGEAMTAPAVTIDPAAPLSDAARLMISRRINRLPVVDGGRLVGIVTRSDVVRAFTRPDSELWEEIRADMAAEPFGIGPDELDVSVEGGHVRIAGTAASKPAADLLVARVRTIPGVVSVDRSALRWQSVDRLSA